MDNTSSQGELVGTLKSGESKVTGPVSVYIAEKNSFCEDIDFGEVLIKGYVVNNKVGAVEIEVQNGSNNDESNKGLLNQYVQANFGAIDTEKNWAGYKYWTIGEKKIYYYKIKWNLFGQVILASYSCRFGAFFRQLPAKLKQTVSLFVTSRNNSCLGEYEFNFFSDLKYVYRFFIL